MAETAETAAGTEGLVAVFTGWAATAPSEQVFALFALSNIVATSIIPFPLGVVGCVIAGILYGTVFGTIAYVVTCSMGATVTLVLVRLLRPYALERLGPHKATWEKLDSAIVREGVQICLLWRIAPIAPFVVSSALIAMTGITSWQFVWTTTIGVIPSTFPIVSAASLGRSLLDEDSSTSTTSIVINVVSILAGIYVVYRLAALAHEVFKRNAVADSSRDAQLLALRSAMPRLAQRYGNQQLLL